MATLTPFLYYSPICLHCDMLQSLMIAAPLLVFNTAQFDVFFSKMLLQIHQCSLLLTAINVSSIATGNMVAQYMPLQLVA